MTSPNETADRLLMPDFPRTKHAPWSPNAARDDLIMRVDEVEQLLERCDSVVGQEKVDGASLGFAFSEEEQPIARNRNHFLRKSFSAKTAAKAQFSSLWNWMYERRASYDVLCRAIGERVSVYGEWLVALHSVRYDALPDAMLTYDVWLPSEQAFIGSSEATAALAAAGFNVVRDVHSSGRLTLSELELAVSKTRCGASLYSAIDDREGAYFKFSAGGKLIGGMKAVSNAFKPGARWDSRQMQKNSVKR